MVKLLNCTGGREIPVEPSKKKTPPAIDYKPSHNSLFCEICLKWTDHIRGQHNRVVFGKKKEEIIDAEIVSETGKPSINDADLTYYIRKADGLTMEKHFCWQCHKPVPAERVRALKTGDYKRRVFNCFDCACKDESILGGNKTKIYTQQEIREKYYSGEI